MTSFSVGVSKTTRGDSGNGTLGCYPSKGGVVARTRKGRNKEMCRDPHNAKSSAQSRRWRTLDAGFGQNWAHTLAHRPCAAQMSRRVRGNSGAS